MMMNSESAPQTLVIGAGELGIEVLRGLYDLTDRDEKTAAAVLLRPTSMRPSTMLESLELTIERADLADASVADLASIFSRYRQVICCTGFVGGSGTQRKITAAALAANVDHYIPWQFGVDYDVVGRGSGQDVWDEQIDVRDMLRAQSRVGWTIISTGMFTSFAFRSDFGIVDFANDTVRALGSWDHRLTLTTPEDIGRVTALVATSHAEFRNQIVYVAGDTISYRELAQIAEHVLDRPFDRMLLTHPDLRADCDTHPSDIMRRYRLAFARDSGVAWPIEETLNHQRRLKMIDAEAWLRRLLEQGAPP